MHISLLLQYKVKLKTKVTTVTYFSFLWDVTYAVKYCITQVDAAWAEQVSLTCCAFHTVRALFTKSISKTYYKPKNV